jgi:hypothetical protein
MSRKVLFENLEVELNDDQAKEVHALLEKIKHENALKLNPFRMPEKDELIYMLNNEHSISKYKFDPDEYPYSSDVIKKRIDEGLCSVDKKIMERRRQLLILHDLLEKFYYDHRHEYKDFKALAYEIIPNYCYVYKDPEVSKIIETCGKFYVHSVIHYPMFNVQFPDRAFAERALNEIVIPFCDKYPEFVNW